MPVKKKKSSRKRVKKNLPPVVVVTKTFHQAEETRFPEKVKKAKEILSEAGFRPF